MEARPSQKHPALLLVAAFGALLLVLTVILVVFQMPGEQAGRGEDRGPLTPEGSRTAAVPEEEQGDGEAGTRPVKTEREEALAPWEHLFQGMVVDNAAYTPLTDFEVTLECRERSRGRDRWIPLGAAERCRSDVGQFELVREVKADGLYRLRAEARGFREGFSRELAPVPGGATTGIEIALDPLGRIDGVVVELESLHAVEGAVVYSATDAGPDFGFDGDPSAVPHAVTDRKGVFALNVATPGRHLLVARHPAYREALAGDAEPGVDVQMALRPGFTIQGEAVDLQGLPAAAAVVLIRGYRGRDLPVLEHRVETGLLGSFSSAPLHPGLYWVRLEEMEGYGREANCFEAERVFILDRDVTGVRVGGSAKRCSLVGTLVSGRTAVPGIPVSVRALTPNLFNVPVSPLEARWEGMPREALDRLTFEVPLPEAQAVTDGEGRFGLYGLRHGEYQLTFSLPDGGRYTADYFRITLEPGDRAERIFPLSEGKIVGRLVDHETKRPVQGAGSFCLLYDLLEAEELPVRKAAVEQDGTFSIPFVPGGEYQCFVSAPGYALEAGRFSFSGFGTKRLEVVLRRAGVILADVRPRHFDRTPPPDEITFELRLKERWVPIPAAALRRDRGGSYVLDRVPHGWVRLRCFAQVTTEVEQVEVKRDEPSRVAFRLDTPLEVAGTVRVKGKGPPPENVRVLFWPHAGSGLAPFYRWHEGVLTGRTDANGAYRLSVPARGTYFVHLYSDGDFRIPLLGKEKVILGDAVSEVHLETGGATLAGTVRYPGAVAPLQDAEVHFSGRSRGQFITLTDGYGRFLFRNLEGRPGRLSGVFCRGFLHPLKRVATPSKSGEEREIDLCLGEPWGSLRLKLLGEWPVSVTALERATVRCHPGGTYYLSQFLMEEDPRTWFVCGLEAGRHAIEVICRVEGITYRGEAEVVLKEGEVTLAEVTLN